jgi:8-oxo-dGTP pyrophosphatase MutT (NUDIX family)
MKIFADNFAISFELKHENPHFSFEMQPFEAIAARLSEGNFFFNNEVFYLDASTLKKKHVLRLQYDEQIRARRAHLVLLFDETKQMETFQAKYIRTFKLIKAAGGLVVNNHNELLMIVRDGKWDLPKGKLEKGEPVPQGAWREVAEETGILDHRVGRLMRTTYHIFERRDRWRFKSTHWFLMEVDGRPEVVPQLNEGITEVHWVPLDVLRDAHGRPIHRSWNWWRWFVRCMYGFEGSEK